MKIPTSIKELPWVYELIKYRPEFVKIADNIGWLFFDKVLRLGVGLFVGIWVARYLGPEQFGLLSFASSYTGLFVAFSTLGFRDVIVRDIVREPDDAGNLLGTAAVMQLLGGFLGYALILGVIFLIRPNDVLAKVIVAVLGSMMLFRATDVGLYWFESQVLSKYIVWVQNAAFLVFVSLKVFLILKHAPLAAFAWATVGQAFVTAGLIWIMLMLKRPDNQRFAFSPAFAIKLLTASWPIMLTSIAVTIYMKIDQVMLGQMAGDDAVGIYSAAVRISEVWYFFPMIIINSVFPAILKVNTQEGLYRKRFQQLFDVVTLISIVAALVLSLFSSGIVRVLFGAEYLPSAIILGIHAWTGIFVFWGLASGKWFLAENRQILSFQRTLLGCFMNVSLNALFIPKWGPVGAAIATLSSQITVCFLYDLLQQYTRKVFYMKARSLNLFRLRAVFREFKLLLKG